MKAIYTTAFLFAAVSCGPAMAGDGGNKAQAGGVNYSSVSQVGVNNIAGVAQNSNVGGTVNDLSSMESMNQGTITVDKQGIIVGSIVGSENASINTSNSGNVDISNKTTSIVAPLQ